MKKTVFQKDYDWESLYDLSRDVEEAVEDYDEFEGTIRVVIEFFEEDRYGRKSRKRIRE